MDTGHRAQSGAPFGHRGTDGVFLRGDRVILLPIRGGPGARRTGEPVFSVVRRGDDRVASPGGPVFGPVRPGQGVVSQYCDVYGGAFAAGADSFGHGAADRGGDHRRGVRVTVFDLPGGHFFHGATEQGRRGDIDLLSVL